MAISTHAHSLWAFSLADGNLLEIACTRNRRAKFRDELKKAGLIDKVPEAVWKKDWVVHSKPVGDGKHALEYIAPYVYRVAISNNRIEKFENRMVTFRFKDSKTQQRKYRTVTATEFIRRFLWHVLPTIVR